MSDRLRVGIVGASRGVSFARAFRAFPETDVVAVCDVDPRALHDNAEAHGIENRFAAYEQMLDSDIDVVVVATPMHLHVRHSMAALDRGIHVLSEVTAATTLDECRWLRDAALRSSARYMMAENYCYMKPNVLVGSLVERGLFGEVYFAEGEYVHEIRPLHHGADGSPTWRYYDQVGKNGCTYGTHSLGPVLQWIGERVVTVSCLGTGVHTDPEHVMEDTVLMNCKTESGALVKIRVDMLSNRPAGAHYYSIQGTRGCYEAPRAPGEMHKIWLADLCDGLDWRSLWDFEDEFMPDDWRRPSEEALRAGHGGSDFFVARAFVDAVVRGVDPPIDVWRALDFTVPGLVSEQSIAQGGAPLPVPDFRRR